MNGDRPDVSPARAACGHRWALGAAIASVAMVALPPPSAAAASERSAAAPLPTTEPAPFDSTVPGAPVDPVASAPESSSVPAMPSTSVAGPPPTPTTAATSPAGGPSTSAGPAGTVPARPRPETSAPPPPTAEPQPPAPPPGPTEVTVAHPADDTTTAVPIEPSAPEAGNAVTPLATPLATASSPVVIAAGHVDMGPRIIDGQWRVQIRDDTAGTPVWRNLEDVVLHGVDAARMTVPEGSSSAFLGAPGSTIWLLPQVQQANIVWPGWNTQDPSVTSGTTGGVTWTLTGVDGPGELILFMTGSFGAPSVVFDSNESFPQQTVIDPNTHVHGNWAFTQPGIYRLHLTMSSTSTAGTALTDSRVLTFAIGPVDPATALPSATTTTTTTTTSTTSTTTTAAAATSTSTTVRPTSAGPTTSIVRTGANVAPPAAFGAASIALGAAAIAVARRRTAPAAGSHSRR